MITRLVLFFTIILIWEGCDVVKPRAQGADNELVVVTSFEDRDVIRTVLTTIFNDTSVSYTHLTLPTSDLV